MILLNNKEYMDWSEYLHSIEVCKDNLPRVCVIFAPLRSGLIPGTILSHSFDTPLRTIDMNHIEDTKIDIKGDALIIDDISDEGKTLNKCSTFLREKGYEKIVTCTLVMKKGTTFIPDVYAITVNKENWVIFPYEMK